ncbi:carbohydrate ABC transporter substrate-binding protein [Paenibacillaceae bacterium]|nr:carbohydrate ABC transporter substrate-binding protein [Paenibacillaceae bacterium]
MKKTLVALLAIIFIVTATACSSGAANRNGSEIESGGGQGSGGQGSRNESEGTSGTATEGQAGEKTPEGEALGGPSTTEKKTVVFSTFFPSDFFKEAKKRYEAQHPNITIELKSIETNDAQLEENLEKFVKTTNTAMLSGKGPDLIEMDQLPSGDYVKKHLLANMGDLIAQDTTFNKEHYFTNVLDGMQDNGGLYGMPMGFFIFALIGNETFIEKSGVKIDDSNWDWSQFASTAKELVKNADQEHQYALGRGLPEYMVSQLVNDQFSTYIDLASGKAKFESEAFMGLLKEVKSLFDEKVIRQDAGLPIFYDTQINSPADYIREMKASEFMPDNRAYKSKLYLKPHASGQQAGGFFRTYQTVGLNEKSAVKAEAWDFLKFMLSDEMQDLSHGAGFPLNKRSYEKTSQDLLNKGKVESIQPIGPMKGQVFDITQQDLNDLEKFINEAVYPVQFKPSKIDDILHEESPAYFSGQKSADDVAKLIQNRVTTVLNE